MSNNTTTPTDTRAELYVRLSELAELIPEMRVGQLIAAVGELCADLHGRGLWDADDPELLEAVWRFHRDFEAVTATASHPKAEADAAPDRGGISHSAPAATSPPRQVS